MSVNVPTNTKIKDEDVKKKLQLYGIYSAFKLGKAPSNEQIDVALNSALASSVLAKPDPKLSSEGKKLVADLRDVIEKAKLLVLTKNHGDLLQDFIWQCQKATTGAASTPGAPVDKETAKQHGNEALEGLRTLGTLLITNGQFRKLLVNDLSILARDIAGDAAQKAASKVNPSEDQLNQIDEAAPDNTWHEKPDLSAQNIKEQARAKTNGTLKSTPQDPETGEDKAKKTLDSTKEYLQDKVPEERRDQTIYRLKKMIVEIQGHEDYQRAVETLLRLAEDYTGHAKDVAGQTTGAVKDAHTDDSLNKAEADLKTLIERFANSTSADDLFDSIKQIYKDADADPELKGYFRALDKYIRRCLKEQGYVMRDEATEEWNQLAEKGKFLARDRYRNHFDRVIEEVKFLGKQFDEDPQNKAFGESVKKLFLDLGQDESGTPKFKKHLLDDVTDIILPGFFENVRYVPIPRIEYSDPQVDAIVENLVIEGDNLAPNVFEFDTDNHWRWGRKGNKSKNKNKVKIAASGIQMDLRDVSYYIKRKQGFPSLTDKGVMDIFLGGTGFSFKAALETADPSDKNHFFKVNTISVDIKHLKIKIKQSKHKLLFSIVKPLLLSVMRPVLQKVIGQQIKDNINKLDAFCYEIHQDAKKAELLAKEHPDQAANIFQRYANAYKAKALQGKEKAESKVEDKQANVAITQHDSIFKNIALPGGISTTATSYKELAESGTQWQSPVFDIGSAPKSSTVPAPAPIVRKPHEATPQVLKSTQTAA